MIDGAAHPEWPGPWNPSEFFTLRQGLSGLSLLLMTLSCLLPTVCARASAGTAQVSGAVDGARHLVPPTM